MSTSIKIGAKIGEMANINISSNTIKKQDSTGLFPSSDEPMGLSHLVLKPLTFFSYDSKLGRYVLNVSIIAGSHHLPDAKNAIECKKVGKNILIFINYTVNENANDTTGDAYNNYRYRFEFIPGWTEYLKGKEIIIVTASGDPQERHATKVEVEDEDEI